MTAYPQILLAGWDFQTTTNGGTAAAANPNAPTVYFANFGTQAGSAAIYLNGTNGSSTWTSAATSPEITTFSGTAVNTAGTSFSTTTSGAASLALANSSANGKSIVFLLSMANYKDLVISYATQKTSTGFNANQWSFSTNGTSFTDFGTSINPGTSFASITLSTLTPTNNASSVWIKYTLSGATATSGNNRLDNIQFSATAIPEPSTYAALFGTLALAGVVIHRRRRMAAKS